MRVLLVEPSYYTQYPPLGLLKLSTHHKQRGDEVRFVRGLQLVMRFVPDEIKVTSLFTWAWRPVWEAVAFYRALFPRAKLSLGGIYASLAPEHAKGCGADEIVTGLLKDVEDLPPDYSIVPEWHSERSASILFSSRGCIRKCNFCAVPKLEGKPFRVRNSTVIKHLVHPEHKRIILWDNNVLGESDWQGVIAELKELGREVDFNQGLDARLVTDEVARALTDLRIPTIRLAYDYPGMHKSIERAVVAFRKAGLNNRRFRHICSYALYNFRDTPEDLFQRVQHLLALGIAVYPMRYQPLSGEGAFEKDTYVGEHWTVEQLNMVQTARRVIGYGGAFPPYEGLVNKFKKARNFEEAFGLYSDKGRTSQKKRPRSDADGFELREFAWDLINMGHDHQFPVHALSGNS